jgi:hypothetical protein
MRRRDAPEPATWMMIMGFGAAGSILRGRRVMVQAQA